LQYTGRRGNNGLQFTISSSSSVAEVNQLLLLSSSLNYKSTIVPADVFQMPVHRKALSLAVILTILKSKLQLNLDIFLYILFLIPLGWIVLFRQKQLQFRKEYLIYLTIAVTLTILGVTFIYDNNLRTQKLSYYGSQMMLIFLILYKVLRSIYFPIFKREPEFSRTPKNKIDILYTLIIFSGVISLPFIIDDFIVQRLLKIR
jgi:hypothetical protein